MNDYTIPDNVSFLKFLEIGPFQNASRTSYDGPLIFVVLFHRNMNDYTIPDNASFLEFSKFLELVCFFLE